MPKVSVFDMSGKEVGQIELSDAVFGIEVSQPAMHQVIVAQLANRRQGTQSALTRSEVSGGGRKPWRQKGTGRARQGSTRSPQWRHGGIVFAPKPRDYSQSVNKKVRRLAMKSAFTTKVNDGNMIVLDSLAVESGKTRDFVQVLKNLGIQDKALVVMDTVDTQVIRSAGNVPKVQTTLVNTLNVYDVMNHDKFVITKDAVQKLEEVYA